MNRSFLVILVFLTGLSFRQRPDFHISGALQGGFEGMKIYLKDPGFQGKILDSTTLHKGHFVLSGSLTSPRLMVILFKDSAKHPNQFGQDRIINLFVEKSKIMLQAPYDSLIKEIDLYGLNAHGYDPSVAIKGSASHDFYLRYLQGEVSLQKERGELFNQYIRFLNPEKDEAHQPRQVGMHLCRRIDVVDSTIKGHLMEFIKDNPHNEVSAYIALEAIKAGHLTTADIDWLTAQFADLQPKGTISQELMTAAPEIKKVSAGAALVDFPLQDTSGNTYQLSQFIGKGKYVLLECWASWCHPCRADIPHLKEAYEAYHPYGFEVISVSLDDKKDNWMKALGQEKMPWLQLSDLKAFNGPLPKDYHINGIPACLLFDPQGKLVTRNMRGSWMDNRLVAMYGVHYPDMKGSATHVTADITGLGDEKVTIHYMKDTVPQTDTVEVKAGKFSWTADMPEPQKVYIMTPRRYLEFFAESGDIHLSGSMDGEALHVEGSATQDESDAYTASLKDLTEQEEALYPKYGKGSKEEQSALESKLEDLRMQKRERANAYIAAHPGNIFSVSLVSDRAAMGDYDDVNKLYQALTPSAQQTISGRMIAARLILLHRSALGQPILDFSQGDVNGKPVHFAAFKGKYVLVDFWASWCGPCRGENPNVLRAYNAYRNKNFTVIGISLDDNGDKWKKAIKEDKMPWTELSDLKGWRNELAAWYGIQGIPSNLLVDPSGRIIAKDLRGEALQKKLAALLN